jgi:O-antigen ligase
VKLWQSVASIGLHKRLGSSVAAGWARRPDMVKVNFHFTYWLYVLSAFAGSISAFFLAAAAIWAFFRSSLKHFALSRNTELRIIAVFFALYPLSELISVLVNHRGLPGLIQTGGALLALSILPVTSRLMLNAQADIANSAGRGASVSAIITLVYCLIQIVFLGYDRPEAGNGNASVLAFFALVLACICLSMIAVVEAQFRRLLIVGVLSAIGAVILSSTRAVWGATIVVVFILVWHQRGFFKNLIFKTDLFSKTFALLAVLLVGAYLILPRVQFTLGSLNGSRSVSTDISISQRAIMWPGGWKLFKASPIFGYGPDSAAETMAALGANPPLSFSHFHNIFLTAALRGGLLEAGALILIFAGLFWIGLKSAANSYQRAGRLLVLTTATGGFISGMTNLLFTHDIANAVFIYTTIVGLALICAKPEPLPALRE